MIMNVTYTIIKRRWLKKPYRWIAQGANHEVIARSSSNYFNEKDAEDTIDILKAGSTEPTKHREDTIVPKKYRNMLPLILIFFCLSLVSSAQSYLKVADKAEYAKYETWCKVKTMKTVYQHGKYKVMKINGQYSDSLGNYVAVNPIKITWLVGTTTPEGKNSITIEPNEKCVSIELKIQAWRRYPSIADFYLNWKGRVK